MFELPHVVGSGFCKCLGPESTAAGKSTPFALNIVFSDVRFDGVIILKLEGRDVWCGIEEERLAMASILFFTISQNDQSGNANYY